LPAEVRIVAVAHPLAGQLLRARHVYRRYGRLWLVVVRRDGGVVSVAVEDTDVLSAGPVVVAAVGDTLVSVEGARRLLGLIEAGSRRLAVEAGGHGDGDGRVSERGAAR
jgi:hypothetical protein